MTDSLLLPNNWHLNLKRSCRALNNKNSAFFYIQQIIKQNKSIDKDLINKDLHEG
jgi:hypothetical protein